jgi:hypothetical protein
MTCAGKDEENKVKGTLTKLLDWENREVVAAKSDVMLYYFRTHLLVAMKRQNR